MIIVRGSVGHDFALVGDRGHRCPDSSVKTRLRSRISRTDLDQFLDRRHMDLCPAICINYFDAMRYCNWLSRHEGSGG